MLKMMNKDMTTKTDRSAPRSPVTVRERILKAQVILDLGGLAINETPLKKRKGNACILEDGPSNKENNNAEPTKKKSKGIKVSRSPLAKMPRSAVKKTSTPRSLKKVVNFDLARNVSRESTSPDYKDLTDTDEENEEAENQVEEEVESADPFKFF